MANHPDALTAIRLRVRRTVLRAATRGAACLALVTLASIAATPRPQLLAQDAALPPIVFVSRKPLSGGPRAGVPGLGSRQRALARGGRLMLRRPDGVVRPLGDANRFFDVSDPCVSYDGHTIAFAAMTRPDSAWRLWTIDAEGRNAKPVTRTDRAIDLSAFGRNAKLFRRYDDLDPCWLPDGRLCFSSTRYPFVAQAGGPSSNLWVVEADGRDLLRITADRDGADEPSIDPLTGRIVFARWWGSRHRASNAEASGVTLDTTRALKAERLIFWHALEVAPDGEGMRLAGGNPRVRTELMAYQPRVLADGTLVGVTADTLSLEPHPGRVRLAVYPGGLAPQVSFPAAPAQMCAPSPLPDGRLLVAYDPSGRGDFGLAVVNVNGSGLTMLTDLRGSLELDPVALVARALPPAIVSADLRGLPRQAPPRDGAGIERENDLFRFDCLNVFSNAPVDAPVPDAPAVQRDLKIRFFAAFSRPELPSGDSVAFLRVADVTRSGAIHEETIPGDIPMFEQLIDAHGHVLETASGPAHVPGFNAGRTGAGTRCVGCHVGHTTIEVPQSYAAAKRFNAAPSATVTATSVAPGTTARALVDRRTRGSAQQVAWIAAGAERETATLRWTIPLAIDSLVLYGVRPDVAAGTDLTLAGCDVALRLRGAVVKLLHVTQPIAVGGTALGAGGVIADEAELRPIRQGGGIAGVPRVGLAEVEAVARIPED